MSKILLRLLNSYYMILGFVFIVSAWNEPETNTGLIFIGIAVGCLILQKLNDVKEKLDDMETLYLQRKIIKDARLLEKYDKEEK
ncbi:hypothetical protein [Clostridium sp.]|uniref:hypothetical protein n=1 Tax=Clostridium sp. TaxID=1506 RepID=UPI001A4C3D56|nr:hypothetical protein [Clostridium sp.]MBK5242130.1 hypothetical protein [Clostridium sp.]